MKTKTMGAAVALLMWVVQAALGAGRSPEAQALLDYLHRIYGEKTLSGTMANVNWNTNEAQWVYAHTGRWPAIAGFDFIHLMASQPGGWIDYSDTRTVEAWHAAGGIVAMMWHWNVPVGSGDGFAFYADRTDFDVRKVLDETSPEYALLVRDIDSVASLLSLLRDRRIPVLWRPLHEAGGGWFWWGRDTEACCHLWRLMHRRFAEAGLDNLIWVFTPAVGWQQPLAEGMRWYPGDEYVDIVGYDVYHESDASVCHDAYFRTLSLACPHRPVALTECGDVAAVGTQWQAGARWLFFMPWYDYRRTRDPSSAAFLSPDHEHASAQWWQEAWAHDFVLSRDQVRILPPPSPAGAGPQE